jgi:hypothetical protein
MAKKKTETPTLLPRMRAVKCTECGERFRTFEAGRTICQNCDGSHDNSAQAIREAALLKQANSQPKKAAQSVDPRTGLPVEEKKAADTPATPVLPPLSSDNEGNADDA